MKAAPFEYSHPTDLEEACALLAADDSARVIAGGQTLVPMMAMRLVRPTRIVDINRIAALSYIREQAGGITIGAVTPQCIAERSPLVSRKLPLLARAIPFIGHAATRARGTIGGSLAHADPAAELALVAVTLDARLTYRAGNAESDVAARDFFVGAMTTSLPDGACLTAVHFPVWSGRTGVGFHEVNARRSDFAFASAAAQVELDPAGTVSRIAIGVGAACETPLRLHSVEEQLMGTALEPAQLTEAVNAALANVEMLADLHASASYRRRAAAALVAQAIADAKTDAEGRKADAH